MASRRSVKLLYPVARDRRPLGAGGTLHKNRMRISIAVSVIGLAFASRTSAAQRFETPLPPAMFGITGGLNLSTFAGEGLGSTATRHGIVGGLMLVSPFAANFSTQLEALYSMKGMKSLSSSPQTYATFKLDYIEIPVMLRADVPLSTSVKPFAFTGPSFDIKVSCGGDGLVNGKATTATCAQIESGFSNGNKFQTLDVGWVVGGGLGFDIHERRVSLGVRYEVGLRTIATTGTSKNRALSLMASIEAPLPRKTRR
jgi:hypothetical protein